jgi:hypothetical protein
VSRIIGPLLVFVGLLPWNSYANYYEFFGASATTSSLGNMHSFDTSDPANNYFAPAILAFSDKMAFNLSLGVVDHNFKGIDNIVVRNDTNSSSTPATELGDVDTDYGQYYNNSIHLQLPLSKKRGVLGASFSSPVLALVDSSSGDPHLPEYVLYRSRYKRALIHLNYAYLFLKEFSFSVGVHMGLQTSADIYSQSSLNGTGYGSTTNGKTKVAPSFAAALSVAKKYTRGYYYLTFFQGMKSNLSANLAGQTSDPPLPFDITATSLLYYDPHTFRVGVAHDFGFLRLMMALEYQLWESFKTPVFVIKKNSGQVVSSDNYEQVTNRNVLLPKIGGQFLLTDRLRINMGLGYRPSPLKGDFSGAGNSVDSDSYLAAAGILYRIDIASIPVELSSSLQYHHLVSKSIVKTTLQEDGSIGEKIGSPGYSIGGSLWQGSIGLRVAF